MHKKLCALLLVTSITCQSNLQAATFADKLGELTTTIKEYASYAIDCGLSTGAVIYVAGAIKEQLKEQPNHVEQRYLMEMAAGLSGLLLIKKNWHKEKKITEQSILFHTGVGLFWGSIIDAIITNQ